MQNTNQSTGAGQVPEETHGEVARAALSEAYRYNEVVHEGVPTLIAENRETYRFYVDFMRAKCRLELQMQAVCRRLCDGDKTEGGKLRKSMTNGMDHEHAHTAYGALAPMLDARDMLEKQQKAYEKQLVKLAKKMPVYEWAQGIKGFGDASLAKIIGECGDLSMYSNPAKLWKRMGLAVIGDGRQRMVSGSAALEHGYCPERRALMWNVGDCIIRAQVRKGEEDGPSTAIGELGELYLSRKAMELEKCQAIDADPEQREKYASKTGKYAPVAHSHNRAKRYIEKRLLRDLWRAWRDATAID